MELCISIFSGYTTSVVHCGNDTLRVRDALVGYSMDENFALTEKDANRKLVINYMKLFQTNRNLKMFLRNVAQSQTEIFLGFILVDENF